MKINIFNISKFVQEEESSVIELIDELLESDSSFNSMDDNELIEET